MLAIVCTLLQIYFFVILGRILMSWIRVSPGTGMAQVASVLYSLTEPLLAPLRNAIPPVRLGAGGLDLSPIVLVLGLQIVQGIICY